MKLKAIKKCIKDKNLHVDKEWIFLSWVKVGWSPDFIVVGWNVEIQIYIVANNWKKYDTKLFKNWHEILCDRRKFLLFFILEIEFEIYPE